MKWIKNNEIDLKSINFDRIQWNRTIIVFDETMNEF